MRQAVDFDSLAVQPKVIDDLLVALVHHHYGCFSIRITKAAKSNWLLLDEQAIRFAPGRMNFEKCPV
jgi:hypothetical protein